jgi:S-DNA-T family DNA segregation ATPase FtsK/SpoIIIE
MKAQSGSRWVDPAPLEVARPRLPWWTMLPAWVKILISPIVLTWLLIWSIGKVARLIWYYPVAVVALVLAAWIYGGLGQWWLLGVFLAVSNGLAAWWWRDVESFDRRMLWARTEVRRLVVYAVGWRTVMRLANLTGDAKGREYRPKLKRIRCEGWRDKVGVRMIPWSGAGAVGAAGVWAGALVSCHVVPGSGGQAWSVGAGSYPLQPAGVADSGPGPGDR